MKEPTAGLTNFDGETFSEELDLERLSTQLLKVFHLMKDGNWRTLQDIQKIIYAPESSISARLRDLRKDKFGGHSVVRQRFKSGGLFEYKLVINIDGDDYDLCD